MRDHTRSQRRLRLAVRVRARALPRGFGSGCVASAGLGGYLLYEEEYQRQLQEHLINKGLASSKEGRWEEARRG